MWHLRWFSFIFKKYERNKTHNMVSLMLNPRFKSLRLVSSFIGQEQVVSIVEEYDQQSLFTMFLKCYHIFHPMVEFGPIVNMQIDEKNSLDIFEMFIRTSEPTKEVVNKELLMFRRFQVGVKNIKCPLKWWVKYEFLFPNCDISCSSNSWHCCFSNIN